MPRALYKLKRKEKIEITEAQAQVLFLVAHLQPTSLRKMWELSYKSNRSLHYNVISRELGYLAEQGYVYSINNKYSAHKKGLELLDNIEYRLRRERLDK